MKQFPVPLNIEHILVEIELILLAQQVIQMCYLKYYFGIGGFPCLERENVSEWKKEGKLKAYYK